MPLNTDVVEYPVHRFAADAKIEDMLQNVLQQRDPEEEAPMFLLDLSTVSQKVKEWREHLPRVIPHYAVKCNDDPVLLRTLIQNGVNFDCASQAEIQKVIQAGCDNLSERVIFAHPTKQRSHVKFAKSVHVDMMTFDNEAELFKIKDLHPEAKLLLRVMTDDSNAVCRLSCKFGADLPDCFRLLQTAKKLSLNVVGVAFHVGSGQTDVSAFVDSLDLARKVFDMAETLGMKFSLLDIGGGFPGSFDETGKDINFPEIASAMRPRMDLLFPPEIKVISEPGRFFAHSCCTLVANVIGKRKVHSGAELPQGCDHDELVEAVPDYLYYINDGVYCSFNNILYDHASHLIPKVLRRKAEKVKLYRCTVFGPTCDGLDTISKNAMLPEVSMGDWIYYQEMGAYTLAAGSTFNGFPAPTVSYVIRE